MVAFSVRSQDGDLSEYGREPCIEFSLYMSPGGARCEWWRIHIDALALSASKLGEVVEFPDTTVHYLGD